MLPTISVTFEGIDCGTVAQRLNDEFSLAVRVGLHCAPCAHRTIGTFPSGTVRISFGYFNTFEDVERLVSSLAAIMRD
jgi:cysteine desulfurase/selenocysteine lyase